jgi:hypothetical protein
MILVKVKFEATNSHCGGRGRRMPAEICSRDIVDEKIDIEIDGVTSINTENANRTTFTEICK